MTYIILLWRILFNFFLIYYADYCSHICGLFFFLNFNNALLFYLNFKLFAH